MNVSLEVRISNLSSKVYALLDGTVIVKRNYSRRQYNEACSKILKVGRRSDTRVMANQQKKARATYRNRVKNAIGVEARQMANAGYAARGTGN